MSTETFSSSQTRVGRTLDEDTTAPSRIRFGRTQVAPVTLEPTYLQSPSGRPASVIILGGTGTVVSDGGVHKRTLSSASLLGEDVDSISFPTLSERVASEVATIESECLLAKADLSRLKSELNAKEDTIAASHAATKSLKLQLGQWKSDNELHDIHLKRDKDRIEKELAAVNAVHSRAIAKLDTQLAHANNELAAEKKRNDRMEEKLAFAEDRVGKEKRRAEDAHALMVDMRAKLDRVVHFVNATAVEENEMKLTTVRLG